MELDWLKKSFFYLQDKGVDPHSEGPQFPCSESILAN